MAARIGGLLGRIADRRSIAQDDAPVDDPPVDAADYLARFDRLLREPGAIGDLPEPARKAEPDQAETTRASAERSRPRPRRR